MEVSEIMHQQVEVIGPQASLRDASDLMHDRDIRHLPVVEAGQVIGIISDRDLRCYLSDMFLLQPETTPASARKTITVRQVMQTKPVTLDPESDIQEAIDCMLEFKIGAVLVTDTEGRLQGVVSYEDVIRAARDLLPM
ncbi:MAG: CBS domain-containing protein [Pseudomonadota bacterium]|jgi:acetoin utilization protein AcuB